MHFRMPNNVEVRQGLQLMATDEAICIDCLNGGDFTILEASMVSNASITSASLCEAIEASTVGWHNRPLVIGAIVADDETQKRSDRLLSPIEKVSIMPVSSNIKKLLPQMQGCAHMVAARKLSFAGQRHGLEPALRNPLR